VILEYGTILKQLVSEDWNFPGFNGSTGLFSLHPYPAKFIPRIHEKIIEYLDIPKDTLIYDPFCGSGTSVIAAQAMGYETIGVDINPIATLVTKVATTPVPKTFLLSLNKLVDNYKKISITEIPLIPNLDHWFERDIQMEIEKIYQTINLESNDDIKSIFRLALSSILVKISKQESDTRYAAIEKKHKSR
jgi:site-specific DNA-methyltransferase (cytosine-N4-specific)